MPFCPTCGTEFLEEIKICADCGVALVATKPSKPDDETLESVELYSATGLLEAEHIATVLGERNLLCRLRVVESSSFPDSGAGLMSEVRLVVPIHEVDAARAIIDTLIREKAISRKGGYLTD